MLIDFTVENYRSIKEPVTLSAVAQAKTGRGNGDAKRKGIKPDNEIAPPFVMPNRKLELLPVLGIFGANESGKTNTLSALDDFLTYIENGRTQPITGLTSLVPFYTEQDAPTRFVLRLAFTGTIFTYELHTRLHQILLERLEYIPFDSRSQQNVLLFERDMIPGETQLTWRNGPELPADLQESQKVIKSYTPFLSKILTTRGPLLRELRRWFTDRWQGLTLGWEKFDQSKIEFLTSLWPERKSEVLGLIQSFSPSVLDMKATQLNVGTEKQKNSIGVLYEVDGQKLQLDISELSTGGQHLLLLAHKLLHSFEVPALVLIDELGSNIHPNITRAIVRLFQNPETNPKRAQLIFTSHDNTLQRGNLLRRDQIWFTQKRADGSTDLYPLTDFHPRNDLALDKAYLDGRFGAVPLLPPDEELLAMPATAGTAG